MYQLMSILCIAGLVILPIFILFVIVAGFACLNDPGLVVGNLVYDSSSVPSFSPS